MVKWLAVAALAVLPGIAHASAPSAPAEREHLVYVHPAGYEVHPDGTVHIHVPPPPPPVERDHGRSQVLRYEYAPPQDTAVAGRAGGLGIGLCYTGPLARYFVTDRFAVELRDYINEDASVIAPRVIGLFDLPKTEFYEFCYYGVEVGWVNFHGRVSRGGGNTAGFFVGIEKEIFEDVMLNVDAGPYWISIRDSRTGIRESGMDFVINSSVVWMLR
jgi:hypothetical protein